MELRVAFHSHAHFLRIIGMLKSSATPRGITLVEVLVVVAILGIVLAMAMVGLQSARESARRASCGNHLRQIGIAITVYESTLGNYPPSFQVPSSANMSAGPVDGWSAQVLILPFLEETITQDLINLNATFDENFAPVVDVKEGKRPISAVRVPVFLCPTEPRDEVRYEDGVARHYPLNYCVNLGEWFVFDPATGAGGNGAFYPESKLSAGAFTDGRTKTLMLAEVRAWQPYYRNAALAEELAIPTMAEEICGWGGAEFKEESGHTEWVDGRAHQTGFTTVFTPNSQILCEQDGKKYDVDWTNQQEGKSATISTYASVTSRSFHPGIVNVCLMDGMVQPIADKIDLNVWRAMSTRNQQD